MAACVGQSGCIRALAQAGADLNGVDNLSQNPLLAAIRHHQPAAVAALLAEGADVSASLPDGSGCFQYFAPWVGRHYTPEAPALLHGLLKAGASADSVPGLRPPLALLLQLHQPYYPEPQPYVPELIR